MTNRHSMLEEGALPCLSANNCVVRALTQEAGDLGARPPSPRGGLSLHLSDFPEQCPHHRVTGLALSIEADSLGISETERDVGPGG